MSRRDTWISTPTASAALAAIDAHFALLGCQVGGGGRLEGFLDDIKTYQTPTAAEMLRSAFEALADRAGDARAVRDLAQGMWMTFLEPADGLARAIDKYGVAAERVGRPGAFGRQWARRVSEEAWTLWVASGGHSGRGSAGIAR